MSHPAVLRDHSWQCSGDQIRVSHMKGKPYPWYNLPNPGADLLKHCGRLIHFI